MANITEARITIDVFNNGVEERFERVSDDVPVRRMWTLNLTIVGGELSLPISQSQYNEFRLIELGARCRMSAIMTTRGTRRQYREIQLEKLPPHTPMNESGYLRGNFRGQVDQYEKNGEIFRSLVLQSFGSQLQLSDDGAILQYENLQNKDCFRVEANFKFDTRWRSGANGKYQTLDPQFYNVVLSDIPAGAAPEGRRRDREQREQKTE